MWPQPGKSGALQGAPFSPVIVNDERVYVLTTAGFECYDQQSKNWRYFPLLSPTGDTLRIGVNNTYATFKNLCLNHEGQLWMNMPGHDGLWTFNPESQQLKRFDYSASNRGLIDTPHGIVEDRFGQLWVASGDHIWRISSSRKQCQKYIALDIEERDTLRRIHTLYEDNSGLIWMPSNSKRSVYCFNPDQEQGQVLTIPDFNNQPFSTNRIIFDKKEVLWLATSRGLLRCDLVSGDVEHVMKMDDCHFATAWDERYLIICSGKGLFVFDSSTRKYWPVQLGEPSVRTFPTVTYAAIDLDGDLWISSWGEGLYLLPKENFDIRRGIATDYEHWSYEPSDPNGLPSNLLAGIAIDADNIAWVAGAENGLNAVDKTTGQVKRFLYEQGRAHGIADNYTWGLLIDKQGQIWISRGTRTFEYFSPKTGHFQKFGLAESLPNYGIANMAMDSTGVIWLNQNQAITSIDPQSGAVHILPQVAVPKLYNEAIAVHPETGEVFFACYKELRSFDPDSRETLNRKPSPLLLSGVSHFSIDGNGTMISLPEQEWKNGKLSLSHQENTIEISYALLDYRHPESIQYQYALTPTGETPKWMSTAGKNTVRFSNLASGRYQFSVKGRNGYGIWAEPVTLPIVIRPPWWATGWAYVGYVCIGLLVLLGLRRYDLRRKMAATEARRLKELDDFKNQFFTNITHEFRTPLTVILGTSNQLEAKVDRPLQGKLGLIRRNGEHLLRLINQILDLAKLESNTLAVNYVQGDVLPFLRYIAESLQSLAENRGVELRTDLASSGIVMDYDPERLLQIVYNLLSNAIKFTPAGGTIKLQAKQETAGKQKHLKLTISDTGIGLSENDLSHIFDRFYQAQRPQMSNSGGTGIGLTLTKELIEALGGSIQVESELGKGTIFTLLLPITRHAAVAATVVKIPPKTQLAFPKSSQSATISTQVLIIEDNADVAEYLNDCLNDRYLLDFAPNGKIGVEKALDTVPDLIISDVMMPEKDGFEVCEILKNDLRTSPIPIVLLTAKAEVEHRIAGLQRGADAYLAKPIHEPELRATLDNLIDLRRKLQKKFQQDNQTNNPSTSPTVNPPETTAISMEEVFLQNARNIIQEHLADATFTVDVLSQQLSMSPRQLHRKLTALTDRTPSALIREARLVKAKSLLENSSMNVSEVAYATGFDDPKYFSRVFKKTYGLPPSKVGKG